MSRKDFVALADYIRARPEAFPPLAIAILADWLSTTNPRFMRDRWLDYVAGKCGPAGGKGKP